MPAAYIYVRYSTPQQEKGVSRERQKELCEAHCRQMGWEVAETIEDLGRSAWKADHLNGGNLGLFAQRVFDGDIPPGSVLVVEQLDRLSREAPRRAQRWMENLTEAGVSIATVESKKLFSDESLKGPSGIIDVLEILLKAQVAHGESERKSQLATDNWQRRHARAAQGQPITRRLPAWIETDGKTFSINETKAAVVRQIYHWSAEGLGSRIIARKLNQRRVPSFSKWKPKSAWTDRYVSLLLNNPAVEGDWTPGASNKTGKAPGQTIVGYFGHRAVDADLVNRARKGVADRKGAGGKYRYKFTNLFASVMSCAACGGRMKMFSRPASSTNTTSVLRKGTLQCENYGMGRGCDRKEMLNYAPFETAVLPRVLSLILDERFFRRPQASMGLAIELADIQKAISDGIVRQGRLVKALALTDDAHEIVDELAVIRRELEQLRLNEDATDKALRNARGEVSAMEHASRVLEVGAVVDDPDDESQQAARLKVIAAINSFVERVVCNVRNEWEGKPIRTFALHMTASSYIMVFDNEGNLLVEQNFLDDIAIPDDEFRDNFTDGDPKKNALLAELVRRRPVLLE